MRAVNIAKLKAKLSEYLRAAKTGETIWILDRRHEVATLSGVSVPEGVRVAHTLVKQSPAKTADAVLEDRG